MPGPPPKNPKTRVRRNKTTTRARMGARRESAVIPRLHDRPCPQCEKRLSDEADEAEARVEAQAQQPKEKTNRKGPRKKQKKVTKPAKRCRACGSHDNTGTLPWHPLTVMEWEDLWREPQAKEYTKVDEYALRQMIALSDRVNWAGHDPSTNDQKELRLQRIEFGLTVMARRRLQWEKEEPEEKDGKSTEPEPSDAFDEPDPRLRLVEGGKK